MMGLIKEPLHVDFYTTGKQMTEEDQNRVGEYIKREKELKKKKEARQNKKGTTPNKVLPTSEAENKG